MRYLTLFALLLLCLSSCHKQNADQSDKIVSMQLIDRNGFSETISIKERLMPYQTTDFLSPQPYQKVLRVYGKNAQGKSTSKITSYHHNGHIFQLLEVVDGRANGLYQEWYANGQLRIEAKVIEGLADINELAQTSWVFDGTSRVFDERGNLVAQIHYEKGLLHTPSLSYHENGKLSEVIPYEKGNIHGDLIRYDQEGNIIELIPYLQNQKHGLSYAQNYQEEYEKDILLKGIYYAPSQEKYSEIIDGNGIKPEFDGMHLIRRTEFQKGVPQGLVEEFLPNGNLHCSFYILNGKKEGEEWEYYHSSTQEQMRPKINLHWHEDQIEGQVKTWYENGILESQREVHQQKKQGLSFAWYKNGDIMLIEDYANDLLIKGTYFKKGDKKPVSKVEDGKGIATLYTSEGIFWKKIPYEKGKPTLYDEPSTR